MIAFDASVIREDANYGWSFEPMRSLTEATLRSGFSDLASFESLMNGWRKASQEVNSALNQEPKGDSD